MLARTTARTEFEHQEVWRLLFQLLRGHFHCHSNEENQSRTRTYFFSRKQERIEKIRTMFAYEESQEEMFRLCWQSSVERSLPVGIWFAHVDRRVVRRV